MIPEAAVLVIGHNYQHALPLETLFEVSDDLCHVLITRQNIRVSRVFVEVALGFEEGDLWKFGLIDHLQKDFAIDAAIFQMFVPRRCSRCQAGKVVKWLMVELKLVGAAAFFQGITPRPGAPSPCDIFLTEKIANVRCSLGRQPCWRGLIRQSRIA